MKWFKKNKKKTPGNGKPATRGLLIYPDTGSVMQVEQILKEEGYDIKVVSPPPKYRTGCDLSVEYPLVEELGIRRLLDTIGLSPLEVIRISSDNLEPLKLVRVKDFGRYLMVRAANMKITVDKESLVIVNISGGGCPDVPYLAREMVGKPIGQAPDPIKIGFSLCAYSLGTAREELLRIMGEKNASSGRHDS